jgi:hypothetical protein
MRGLPFKVLLLLVALPPVIYMFGLQGAESLLHNRYRKLLDRSVPGDTQPLLSGQVALADRLQEDIGRLYAQDYLLAHGVRLAVVVRTSKGRRLYPPAYVDSDEGLIDRNPIEVASRNYALLSEGLVVDIDVRIYQNTVVANVILAACLLAAFGILGGVYQFSRRRLADEEAERHREMQRWRDRQEEQQAALASLRSENAALAAHIERIRSEMEHERNIANRNEEDLFAEMADLEKQLQTNLDQQEEQQRLIADLESQLENHRPTETRLPAKAKRSAAAWHKRFTGLYKETIVLERALKGFARLPENLQIKAEEVVQQLNTDPEAVPVKRKLFQRKGRDTVLEVVFARKGRLYFRRNKNRKVEVLAIGTKNDQLGDLGFLDRMGSDS